MTMALTHQEINRRMNLFETFEEAGAGHIFWKPNGYIIYDTLCEWIKKEHLKRGYQFIRTPTVYRAKLWKTSGHYDKYKENMYFLEIDDEEYGIKPMNCPAHILLYKSEVHSYKDLPLRYFEFGYVHRHELSGVLSGLFRVRSFTQDDAHIFCKPEDIMSEVSNILDLVEYIMDTFELKKRKYALSTMPEQHIGDEKMWDYATDMLEQALKENGIKYKIKEGEGAFYGPKIDLDVTDSQKREWQLSTIQLDFNLPERFDVTYINKQGEKERAIMIHRAILGSIERFIGIMLEHYQGWLPTWLAPEQLRIIPVSEKNMDYARYVYNNIKEAFPEARIKIDDSSETVAKKVRNATVERVPVAIVGDKEEVEQSVMFRKNKEQKKYSIEDFVEKFVKDAGLP